jgi:PadR family transcriptional regulator, regulatory protein AphA
MSLEYAILGFLNYKPFSGYDLKKAFDNSIRHFWYADQSQIYRTLARLTGQGWADVEVVEQTERPDRKVYSITPAGREALRAWLAGPFPTEAQHSGPLIQVFFAGQLSDEEILAKFKQAAALFRSVLDRYNQVPSQIGDYVEMVDSQRETYFWMLTLELGIKTMQAQLEWAENVIRVIGNKQLPANPEGLIPNPKNLSEK